MIRYLNIHIRQTVRTSSRDYTKKYHWERTLDMEEKKKLSGRSYMRVGSILLMKLEKFSQLSLPGWDLESMPSTWPPPVWTWTRQNPEDLLTWDSCPVRLVSRVLLGAQWTLLLLKLLSVQWTQVQEHLLLRLSVQPCSVSLKAFYLDINLWLLSADTV